MKKKRGNVVQKNIILCFTGEERVVQGEKVERKSDQNLFHGTARFTIFGRTKRRMESLVPLRSVPFHNSLLHVFLSPGNRQHNPSLSPILYPAQVEQTRYDLPSYFLKNVSASF
ncbi:hypothetical protein DVH24_027567 [Malus domestica]|uniref:Uncharacterized protein n=1 Tax=Malus domestica TaxID=3750 RepID=A0A498H9C0_MALDO|nr:hypothetical protein DVH24_027567 [Malus domestica]